MVVLLGAFPDSVLGVEHALHVQPGLDVHQRGVGAVVGDAAEGDGAVVVGVGQDLVQPCGGQRLGGLGGGGAGGQPAGFQLAGEGGQRPVAGGVGGEREPDQIGALGVDFDVADLVALRVGGAGVEVADGRPGGGAADLGFLDHALDDFLGEVEGVELGDGGHDAVHQHARGGFVDILGDRHEGDTGVAEGGVDDRVVEAVAGEPVDLVDDAVADGVLGDVAEHVLKGTPVGGLG
nr:hypothetical protein [Propionicimonas sp.]